MKKTNAEAIIALAEAGVLVGQKREALTRAESQLERAEQYASGRVYDSTLGMMIPSYNPADETAWKKANENCDKAEAKVRQAKHELAQAEQMLRHAIRQARPRIPVDSSTNKNRVPFVASEMEYDWDEVQCDIESEDDRLRFSQFVSESTLDRPNCRCCRRARAHFVNNNAKPSKARK